MCFGKEEWRMRSSKTTKYLQELASHDANLEWVLIAKVNTIEWLIFRSYSALAKMCFIHL